MFSCCYTGTVTFQTVQPFCICNTHARLACLCTLRMRGLSLLPESFSLWDVRSLLPESFSWLRRTESYFLLSCGGSGFPLKPKQVDSVDLFWTTEIHEPRDCVAAGSKRVVTLFVHGAECHVVCLKTRIGSLWSPEKKNGSSVGKKTSNIYSLW